MKAVAIADVLLRSAIDTLADFILRCVRGFGVLPEAGQVEKVCG
jgi:hypothetical protein